MSTPIPENEEERLSTLQRLEILDTLPEQNYDNAVELASYICDTPIALVSLVDENRQWFKAKTGLDVVQTDRASAFCAHSIMDINNILVVPDALNDERFSNNPLVLDNPNIRLYAGAPIVCNNLGMGTLCVIDTKPRELSDEQLSALRALSDTITEQLQLRLAVNEIRRERKERKEKHAGLLSEIESLKD